MSTKQRVAAAAGAFFLLWLLSNTLYTLNEVQQALLIDRNSRKSGLTTTAIDLAA